MSFAISGFGAQQYRATPQPFQALSLSGSAPEPPRQPYGSLNQTLVPVTRPSAAIPFSLSLAAAPVSAAIDAVAVRSPALRPPSTFSTAFAAAHKSNELLESGKPDTFQTLYGGFPPEGPVALGIRVQPRIPALTRGPASPAVNAAQTSTAPALALAKIVDTVKNLAVAAVYPQPVFSFKA